MAKLVYSVIASLDGYLADESGNFEWGAPTPELFAFINDLERDVGTYLYGRRMYETMLYWETVEPSEDDVACERDFTEIWGAADKVVYSTTLESVSSNRTRIERVFDPDSIRHMKETAPSDISIAGENLATQAMAAGLIDEVHVFLTPITVGGGTPALPCPFLSDPELLAADRFPDGVVHLHYRSKG